MDTTTTTPTDITDDEALQQADKLIAELDQASFIFEKESAAILKKLNTEVDELEKESDEVTADLVKTINEGQLEMLEATVEFAAPDPENLEEPDGTTAS